MSDLETLLAPLLDSAPDPAPLAVVSARASSIRRRRRVRVGVLAVLAVAAVAGGIAAALPRDTNGVSTVGPPPVGDAAPSLTVGPALWVPEAGMDMISAFGSLWISQPERVARLDQVTGRVIATIPVPGTSDFRNLAGGAGSIWVDDTATEVVTRIDPTTNRVRATIPLPDPVFVTDGVAFLDGKLWVVRPMPLGDSGADVVTIDPTTERIVHRTRIPRTFDVLAGSDALWYVADAVSLGRALVRLDPQTLLAKVVRRDAIAVLAIGDGAMWLQTAGGVIEVDEQTGARIGRTIPLGPAVNTTAAVADGVLWLAWQPDSSSPGAVTPYDTVTHRALSKPVPVGLPILAVTVTRGAVWVAVDYQKGVARIPFSR